MGCHLPRHRHLYMSALQEQVDEAEKRPSMHTSGSQPLFCYCGCRILWVILEMRHDPFWDLGHCLKDYRVLIITLYRGSQWQCYMASATILSTSDTGPSEPFFPISDHLARTVRVPMLLTFHIIRASMAEALAPHHNPAGQRWLYGANHLSTFGWFHLHDFGCMESARWVTPAEGATIVCAGLGILVNA